MLLYAQPSSARTQRLLAVAQTNEIDLSVVCDDTKSSASKSDSSDSSNDSFGKIPVLDTGKGCIFSTNAIGRFLARIRPDLGLYGQNFSESGEVDSWVDYCTHELEVPLCAWTGPMEKLFPEVPQATKRAQQDTLSCLQILNKHLIHRTFMVGESLTYADIHLASILFAPLETHGVLTTLMKDLTNLKRWYMLIVAQSGFKFAFGASKAKFTSSGGGSSAIAPSKPSQGEKGGNKKDKKGGQGEKKDDASKAQGAAKTGKSAEEIDMEKKIKKVAKEGGKRGVEIEGAADLGGLTFFCTSVQEPDGNLSLLNLSLDSMNAESDPTEEERKGGSGKVGKIVFSAGASELAMIAYVPKALQDKCQADVWLKAALTKLGKDNTRQDEIQYYLKEMKDEHSTSKGKMIISGKDKAFASIKCDGGKTGRFAIKIKDDALNCANSYLREHGLFPDGDDDDEDEMCFGDDDFPA